MLISAGSISLVVGMLDAVAKGVSIVSAVDALHATTERMKSEGRTEPTMEDLKGMVQNLYLLQEQINRA